MPFSESIQRPARSRDQWGNRRAARMFQVWGVTQEQILNDPGSVTNPDGRTLPLIGDPLVGDITAAEFGNDPFFAEMKLLDYTVTQQGTILVAIANYTTEIADYGFSSTFQIDSINLPFCAKKQIGYSPEAGGIKILQWFELGWRVETPILRYQLTYRMTKTYYMNRQQNIINQIRNVHDVRAFGFSLGLMRFEAPDIQNLGPQWVSVRYSWVKDPGVGSLVDSSAGSTVRPGEESSVLFPPADKGGLKPNPDAESGKWIRPPFFRLQVCPAINTTGIIPRADQPLAPFFRTLPDFNKYVPDGHLSLPGVS